MPDRIATAKKFVTDNATELAWLGIMAAGTAAIVTTYAVFTNKQYKANLANMEYRSELLATALDTTTDAIINKINNP